MKQDLVPLAEEKANYGKVWQLFHIAAKQRMAIKIGVHMNHQKSVIVVKVKNSQMAVTSTKF